jgi:hypothetical protein
MKKVLIICALMLSTVSLINAQGRGPQGTPEERSQMMLSRLPATLNLTADQKTKITGVYLVQAKSQDSLRTAMGQGGDRTAMIAKYTEMTAATDKKILALLTADQKPAYEEYVKTRPAFGRGGGR